MKRNEKNKICFRLKLKKYTRRSKLYNLGLDWGGSCWYYSFNDFVVLMIDAKTKIISLDYTYSEAFWGILYDLIQAGLVEKVKGE